MKGHIRAKTKSVASISTKCDSLFVIHFTVYDRVSVVVSVMKRVLRDAAVGQHRGPACPS